MRPSRLGGAARGVEPLGHAQAPVGHQRGAADLDAVAVDDALDAEPFAVGEALDRGQRAELLARRGGDRVGDRVLGGVLERAGEPQHLARRVVGEPTSTRLMRPVVTVPVLSSTIVSTGGWTRGPPGP